jgi:hypothetical protein
MLLHGLNQQGTNIRDGQFADGDDVVTDRGGFFDTHDKLQGAARLRPSVMVVV